jgi:YVTN family beta-propeller protein
LLGVGNQHHEVALFLSNTQVFTMKFSVSNLHFSTFKGTFIVLLFGLFLSSVALSKQAPSDEFVYVTNQGEASVSVINATKNIVETTIDLTKLGFTKNAKPHHAIAEPDGSFWYVTLIGENKVLKFDADNNLVDHADLLVPGLMALSASDDVLYVGRSMSAVNPPQSFGIIRRSDMEVLDEADLFFTRPHAIAVNASAKDVYVASLSSGQFIKMNTSSEQTELNQLEGDNPVIVNFAISPDGNTMVGTGQISGKLLVFDIREEEAQLTRSIDVKAQPWNPVYTPDGKFVYFGNKQANIITIVDMESMKVVKELTGNGIAQPHGSAVRSDGKFVYISNNNMSGIYTSSSGKKTGTVVVVDTERQEIAKVLEVGMNPTGMGGRVLTSN